jgi:hypothetical protein
MQSSQFCLVDLTAANAFFIARACKCGTIMLKYALCSHSRASNKQEHNKKCLIPLLLEIRLTEIETFSTLFITKQTSTKEL